MAEVLALALAAWWRLEAKVLALVCDGDGVSVSDGAYGSAHAPFHVPFRAPFHAHAHVVRGCVGGCLRQCRCRCRCPCSLIKVKNADERRLSR